MIQRTFLHRFYNFYIYQILNKNLGGCFVDINIILNPNFNFLSFSKYYIQWFKGPLPDPKSKFAFNALVI